MKLNKSIEYKLFPIPFTVLTLCGNWYPESWSTKEKNIYKIFMFFLLMSGIILFVEISIKIIISKNKNEFDLENVFAEIVFAVGIYKKINIMFYRQKIKDFISKYTENKWFKPKSTVEKSIYAEVRSETRWVTLIYTTFIVISIILRSLTPILESKTLFILLLDAWYPYKLDNFIVFWLTYIHQVVSGVTLTCMHICTDTLFVGLLLQMRCQLNILKYRLRQLGSLNHEKNNVATEQIQITKMISQHAREHENIYRFGRDLQTTFKPILIGQIVVVVPSVIINVYFLSVYTDRLNSKYLTTFFFALVSLIQIYMLCWYGNEILINSINVGDALYKCNWTQFSLSSKKIILTIIARSSKPLMISAAAVVPLNISSFINIMKTSYSAFNLLQRTAQ